MAVDKWYFDEVDTKYYDNISECLAQKDVSRLCSLVPNLTEEEAMGYIERYADNYDIMMQKIRRSEDTSEESAVSYALSDELFEKANLSGDRSWKR